MVFFSETGREKYGHDQISGSGQARLYLYVSSLENPLTPELELAYREILSSSEEERNACYATTILRQRDLLTRALLRCALSLHAPVAPENWRFSILSMGKPVIASCHDDLARWQFNLSGSRNMVVVAICKGRAVGVDIELSAVANELLDSPLIFSLCERASLQKLPLDERKRRFLDHWAIKEAYLKASGKGMSIPLNSIAPDFGEPGRIRFSAIGGDEPLHANWTFMQLDVSGHGTVSICLEGTAMPATELALFMPFNSPPRNLSFRILRRS